MTNEQREENGAPDEARQEQGEDGSEATEFSPASQVGRARAGGGSESALDPDEEVREGWPIPEQDDVPPEWPEPTVD